MSEKTLGRDPIGSGSHLSGEADKSSSSLRDFDPSRGFAEIAAKQVVLGLGRVDISTITHRGKVGVLFVPRNDHVEFGLEGLIEPGELWPSAEHVVLWVDGRGPLVAISQLAEAGIALAGEAGTAETQSGSVHEHAAPQGATPESDPPINPSQKQETAA